MKSPPPPLGEDELRVWKALADPHRRAILDLLRQQPMTTGELTGRFTMSRFGVMKHLGVLEEAGLVLVRRQGRERWNHLNPVPIQRIHQRWIRPFEAPAAEALLRLAEVAERTPGDAPMTTTAADTPTETRRVHMELTIQAPPERVWQAFVDETSAWWPKTFYNSPTPLRLVIEARVGGRVYEDWGNDEGMLWATVLTVKRGEKLQWVGDLSAEFGGPARTIATFTLKPVEGATLLQFHEAGFGQLTGSTFESLTEGWNFLLGDCLKGYVEEGRTPERPETVA